MYKKYYDNFLSVFHSLSQKYDKHDVFLDFLKMSSISLSNAFNKNQELEEEYLRIAKKYTADALDKIAYLLAQLALMFQHQNKIEDILGQIYSQEGLINSYLRTIFHTKSSFSLYE